MMRNSFAIGFCLGISSNSSFDCGIYRLNLRDQLISCHALFGFVNRMEALANCIKHRLSLEFSVIRLTIDGQRRALRHSITICNFSVDTQHPIVAFLIAWDNKAVFNAFVDFFNR